MFHVILYQPEIPPNTGNVIRLCANTGAHLHLIEPLGFEPDDRQLRRAGLDYGDWSRAHRYPDLAECLRQPEIGRVYMLSTHHARPYTGERFRAGDAFVFGPETRGLPADIRRSVPEERRLTLPMLPNNRSLNLANSVAVVIYEAWRQVGFAGAL
ncbi:MAG: tRNA (cytidine(34)-2'-O)-methyltransferase [Arenicellales bacterium]|jgi:tRNA (cytidine/uridine-2'-O-)-methyltransferase